METENLKDSRRRRWRKEIKNQNNLLFSDKMAEGADAVPPVKSAKQLEKEAKKAAEKAAKLEKFKAKAEQKTKEAKVEKTEKKEKPKKEEKVSAEYTSKTKPGEKKDTKVLKQSTLIKKNK